MRVGEAAVGLVGGARDAVEREQRLDLRDLGGLDERGVQTERREPRDVVAAGVGERLGHRQQVARLDVAGVADPDLLAPAHDRVRAAHREQRGDRVGVVAAHHAERAARVAAPSASRSSRITRPAPRRHNW